MNRRRFLKLLAALPFASLFVGTKKASAIPGFTYGGIVETPPETGGAIAEIEQFIDNQIRIKTTAEAKEIAKEIEEFYNNLPPDDSFVLDTDTDLFFVSPGGYTAAVTYNGGQTWHEVPLDLT